MIASRTLALALGLSLASSSMGYDLVREYSGSNFFEGWDFYGSWDNLTLSKSSIFPPIMFSETFNSPT